MMAILTDMNIHEGSNVSWGQYCSWVFIMWRDFEM